MSESHQPRFIYMKLLDLTSLPDLKSRTHLHTRPIVVFEGNKIWNEKKPNKGNIRLVQPGISSVLHQESHTPCTIHHTRAIYHLLIIPQIVCCRPDHIPSAGSWWCTRIYSTIRINTSTMHLHVRSHKTPLSSSLTPRTHWCQSYTHTILCSHTMCWPGADTLKSHKAKSHLAQVK